jgi:hypothetical protein
MNLLQLKWYAVESARKNPTLKNEIYDIVELAISEIEEGGSEDHECSLAQRDIEFMVNELLIETEMEKINSPGEDKTVHGYSNHETYTMISHIHNNQEWLEDAFKNIRQYDNPIRLGVFFTALVFKNANDSLKDSFGIIAFSNINWFEISENLKEMMPKAEKFTIDDYLMIVDGEGLKFNWKGRIFLYDCAYTEAFERAEEICVMDCASEKLYNVNQNRFVKVTHEWIFVAESDRCISEWRDEDDKIVGINFFQGMDSWNTLQDSYFLPDVDLTKKVLAKKMPVDDAIWSVHFEENVSKEELLERLALANTQASILFDQLRELGDGADTMVEELSHAHNIKLLTDVSSDEWKYQD